MGEFVAKKYDNTSHMVWWNGHGMICRTDCLGNAARIADALNAQAAPPAALAVPATMADGWRHDICATLNRVMPSWIAAGKTPIEAACNAIEALAAVACEAHDKPAAQVPEGMALVPVEPTEAMIVAAREHHEGDHYLPVSLWRAMLAAAANKESGNG